MNFGTSNSSIMDPLTDELRAAVDNLSIGAGSTGVVVLDEYQVVVQVIQI